MVSADFETFEPQLRSIAKELDQVEGDIELLQRFSGTRDEHRQLSDSIREQHRAAERLIEHIELEASEDPMEEKKALHTRISQLRLRSLSTQRSFRRAMLQYSGNSTREAQRDRALLLSGAATPAELRKRKVRTGNATLNAAADVTTALQETVSMMNDEIDKSVGNVLALSDSTATLRKTKDRYITMSDVLKTSANLIRALEQADAVDRWLMLAGLVLFVLVSFNILRKRIWIPGLYTAFSIVRYLFTLGMRSSAAGPTETSAVLLATADLGSVSLATTSVLTTISALSVSVAYGSTSLSTTVSTIQPTLDPEISESFVASDTAIVSSLASSDLDESAFESMDSAEDLDESDSENVDSAEDLAATATTPAQLPPFTRQRHYKPPVERETHLEL
ncbi:Vesicle transport protein S20 [Coemansia sp. RSA 1813]|nr:Vesicle transport protein S20 [Coemansia sp. RSA 1646]KAJ1771977.1 Vesicle transport protein S20 [Coemansia sp. RSA 1843]KAJ2089749.1 Vesicle transport protein S20 [Coemansia sp. RSA 986]KAJ2214246.1 Vesicle transport protein S20 [Coemansia sp. RSA 487]KAJ2569664.1 Vesicle transport protein S20 [Coemansia sp. RSA 1813]